MKFTQWVVEWAIYNGPRVPMVWRPVIVNGRARRPKMCDSKRDATISAQLRRSSTNGVKYRVRKVTFEEKQHGN